jgi:phage terminase small subunit
MENSTIKNLEVLKGDNLESEKDLYTPLKKLPSPKFKYNLTEDQKYWYTFYGELLIATKKLAPVDLFHLHRVARSIDYYLQAENAIQKKGYEGGLVQKTPNNYYQISAHVTVREKMLKDIESVSSHFGFSFLDRKKLAMEKPDTGQLSLFEMFMNKKKQA